MAGIISTGSYGSTVWIKWCDSTTTASTAFDHDDTSTVWDGWCTTAATNSPTYYYPPQPKPRELTAAEIAEREARRERDRKAEEKRLKEEKISEGRANELLLSLLDPEQKRQLQETKRFYVITPSGQRYEIDCKLRMHNVFEVDAKGVGSLSGRCSARRSASASRQHGRSDPAPSGR